MNEYERLRSIGCSVETADALAPMVEILEQKKKFAFYLWATGMTQDESSKLAGLPLATFNDCLKSIRKKCSKNVPI